MKTRSENISIKAKKDISDLQKELEGLLNKRRNFGNTDLEKVEIELQSLKRQATLFQKDQK